MDGVGVGITLKVGWGGVGDEGVGLRDFKDYCFQFFHCQVNVDYLEFLNYLVDSKWWSAGRSRGRTEEVNKERLTKIKKKQNSRQAQKDVTTYDVKLHKKWCDAMSLSGLT